MLPFAFTIFLGAFLVFQVQPLIGKYILPWFGGGPGVWTTCLLFFQVFLLAGYAYAYVLSRLFRVRTQALVHAAFLAGALLSLPITPGDAWKPAPDGNPAVQILVLLAVHLGLPYLVLSATGPLMQEWFRRSAPGVSPYRLYALSNLGSLLALVSYPFAFEPHLTRVAQARFWSFGLAAYALAAAWCVVRVWRAGDAGDGISDASLPEAEGDTSGQVQPFPAPTAGHRLLWLALPASASVLLLAVTNKICQDVATIPFLWVLPLALYLVTFILCFDSPRWYSRRWFALVLVGALVATGHALHRGLELGIAWQVVVFASMLFVGGMVCHGELYRLRPHPRRLTSFYLHVAAGGALGGVCVAVLAPALFDGFYELQLALLAIVCLRLALGWSGPESFGPRLRWIAAAACAAFAVFLGWNLHETHAGALLRSRNFYGVLAVHEYERDRPDAHYYALEHGRITHGIQFVAPDRVRKITSYFGPRSGLGLALREFPRQQGQRIGLLGLGVGTIAAYGKPGDTVRIYEIDPAVRDIAVRPFSYLATSAAHIEVVMGDGRLSLEKEPPQQFDFLIMDAFSSDAVPVHLLTREAFAIYERHLKPDGAILVNISNRYVNLRPVVENAARACGMDSLHIDCADGVGEEDSGDDGEAWWLYGNTWMILSRNRAFLDNPALRGAASRPAQANDIPLWTDDYSSMFRVLQ